jgi:ssDNA-binding Zn-finger/Zn-ribbon topoisomerase 1
MPKVKVEDEPYGEDCEKCGRPLVIKMGRFGRFIACSGFPTCRNAKPLLEKVGVRCPECGEGELVVRTSKKRRTFYGCDRFPACTFTVWDRPLSEPCPNCGGFQVQTASGPRCLAENPVVRDPAQATPAKTTKTSAKTSATGAKKSAGTRRATKRSSASKPSAGRTPAGARR